MRRLLILLLVAGAGGWFFFHKYRIDGIDRITLRPRSPGGVAAAGNSGGSPVATRQRPTNTIRIAAFDLDRFDAAKLGNPPVLKALLDVARQFDVIALEGITTPRDDLMAALIEQLDAGGRHFDYVIGPRLGRDATPEQFAFVFDAASVEVDRTTMYTVNDPGRLLLRDPLVATFRVRGPAAKDAFTFTLVNVHLDPQRAPGELDALAEVYRAVRDNGLHEDDIILLGDLEADDRRLGLLGELPNMTTALAGVPTNTRGTKMYDNILFNREATSEFTGRAGVIDLLHECSLTMPQALAVSDHLPIWAEFSIYEGGQPGRMAVPAGVGGRGPGVGE